MARNANLPLTVGELATVAYWSPILFEAIEKDESLTFTYVKPTGERSVRTGTPFLMMGQDSTLAVRMVTADGERTFNLRNMFPAVS